MSGIYGFTQQKPADGESTHKLRILQHWNQIFGREENDQCIINGTGIGCHVEHFSDKFPFGGPILYLDSRPVVLDTLLYNRDELTAGLGMDRETPISDEELLLTWVREKGFEALAQVNGDFAGAMFDPDSNEWCLFRDHFGVRPLYYYLDDALFAFSTDLRGLLTLPGVDRSLDEWQLYTHLSGSNFLSPVNTDFARIKMVRPASVTRIRKTEQGFHVEEQIYWNIRQKRFRYKSEAAYQQKMCELITDSVNRRCDAIPGLLGAELSGGFDSGVIDILISRHGRDMCCYSWSEDPQVLPLRDGTDERKVILDICGQEQIECRFHCNQDERDYRKDRDPLIPPFVDTTFISCGSKWMRAQGARVVFSGHGGDEGVSHRASRYELFYNREYIPYFKLFWHDLKGKKLRLLRTVRAGMLEVSACREKLSRNKGISMRYYSFLNEGFVHRVAKQNEVKTHYFNFAPHKYVMQGGSRPRMENAAYQGASIGVRYLFPYIDYRVFDYSLSIPRRLYLNHTWNRAIFREAFRHIIPKSLYEVTYKDAASLRDVRQQRDEEKDVLKSHLERISAALDPVFWKEIIDLDRMERFMTLDRHDPERDGISPMIIYELDRCILIQNLMKNINDWRLSDESGNEII